MNLIEYYTSVLKGFGLIIENDLVFLDINGKKEPVKISGKQICLPTDAHLRAGDWDNVIAFHPICENVTKGEYPTLKWLRKQANLNLTKLIGELWAGLMQVAINKDLHNQMTPSQISLLKVTHEADEKCLQDLQSKIINEKVSLAGNSRLIAVTQKHGGKVHDTNYKRVCNISFPIDEQFEHKNEILGVNVRSKGMKSIVGVFKFIFPEHEELYAYNFGSNEDIAPYFHSLLGGYYNVVKRIKEVALSYDNLLSNAHIFSSIHLDWVEHMDSMNKYKGLVPVLEGNKGEDSKTEQAENNKAFVNNPTQQTTNGVERLAKAVVDYKEPIKSVETVNKDIVHNLPTSQPLNKTRSVDWGVKHTELRMDREESRPLDSRERVRLERERQEEDERFYRRNGYWPDERDTRDRGRDKYNDNDRHYRDDRTPRDTRYINVPEEAPYDRYGGAGRYNDDYRGRNNGRSNYNDNRGPVPSSRAMQNSRRYR